jgi:menaquinol-cytochrome c reductase iron-sulfur subunit
MGQPEPPTTPDRRDFVKKAGAIVVGGVAGLIPAAASITVFLTPLGRKSQTSDFIRVTSMDSLPADGVPRKFSIIADRSDAWNKSPQVPVGAVYLRRTPENKVEALNVVCPHAGCFVDFVPGKQAFFCPCHNSSFALDGRIADPKSPSPRGLDSLDVEVRNEAEVWVKFQNFLAGRHEKTPVS